MSVFDDVKDKVLSYFSIYPPDTWVKWIAQYNEWQDDCDKFNNCYFIFREKPNHPYHFRCKCKLVEIPKPIPNRTAFADADIRKFTEYVFNEENSKGKFAIFKSLGYTIDSSQYLLNLYKEQALEKYCNGDYVYKGVNKYARIEIIIELSTETKGNVKIKTGWVVEPNGIIRLTTPFSGNG